MERLTAIIIVLIFLLLAGCQTSTEDFEVPVSFYFPKVQPGYGQADSLIYAEIREGSSYDTVALLDLYFRGPQAPESRNIFPGGTRMVSLEFAEDTLVITLADEFATLTGIELNLACACIYATGSELFGLDKVEIRTENELLDGQPSVIVDGSTYLLQDVIVTPAPTGGTE